MGKDDGSGEKVKGHILFVIKFFYKGTLVLIGATALFFLRIVFPIFKIRIGRLEHLRIGELGSNTELFLRRRTRFHRKGMGINIFVSGKPVNRQLLKMIQRRLIVWESNFLVKIYDNLRPLTNSSPIWIDLSFRVNEYDEYNNIPPQLYFTVQEKDRGQKLLEQMGIKKGTPFVCFQARDRSYLDQAYPQGKNLWRHNDFRDCDIKNYLPAVNYLAEQGIYSLRMGTVVAEALPENIPPRVIDYATKFRSDFGDIYLPAHCKFFLGNTSGIRYMSTLFNVPIIQANSVPLGDAPLLKKDLFIPKKYWSREKRRYLTFKEIIELQLDWDRIWPPKAGLQLSFWDLLSMNKVQEKRLIKMPFEELGIEIIENTAKEILAVTQEMNERLDGKCCTTPEDEERQQSFRNLFPPGNHTYGFPSRIGADFLRQNQELLADVMETRCVT